jgi:hypothetical protein
MRLPVPGYACAGTDFGVRGKASTTITRPRCQHPDKLSTAKSQVPLRKMVGLSGANDPWGESSWRARLGLCARALNSPNLRNPNDQPENRR